MEKKSFEQRTDDVMDECLRWETKIHEHGLVALVDVMPRLVPEGLTADTAIVQAARVSYGDGTKSKGDDTALIRYMLRHNHTSPFEMVEFKFHCKMPMFIARQWIRHRTANVNEVSARYSIIKDNFYNPELKDIKLQSKANKQGGSDVMSGSDALGFLDELDHIEKESYRAYESYIAKGMARETARMILPVNIYTEWYWKIDLHNLFHFLHLRMDSHAQQEIQDYAKAIFEMVQKIVPVASQAFLDYKVNAMTLTALDIQAITARNGNPPLDIHFNNDREFREYLEKLRRLEYEAR